MLRRHPKPLRESPPAQPELFSEEPDLGSPQRRRLPDEQAREELVELLRVRELDLLVPVTAFPDRCVDQLHVVQPRFPIVSRRVDQLLRRPALSAPSRWPSASHLSESRDDRDPRPGWIERNYHGQVPAVQIRTAHRVFPVSEPLIPRGLADMAGSQNVFDVPLVEVPLASFTLTAGRNICGQRELS